MKLSPRTVSVAVAVWTGLTLGNVASSQTEQCEPGVETLVGASEALALATPRSMTREVKDGMVYARGTYAVTESARGEPGDEITVEFSCIDMEAPSGTDDVGHCPGGEGVVLPGFEEVADGFQPAAELLTLFLSREETSPLDGKTVRGDVTFRPFRSCDDRPRDFESPREKWKFVLEVESEQRPSSPVEAVTKKAREQKESKKEKSGCG